MKTEPIGFKGTEGRWRLGLSNKCAIVSDKEDYIPTVAICEKCVNGIHNAELIAASKDMAIALQRLLPILQSERTQSGVSLDIRYLTEYEQATEALTKAGL